MTFTLCAEFANRYLHIFTAIFIISHKKRFVKYGQLILWAKLCGKDNLSEIFLWDIRLSYSIIIMILTKLNEYFKEMFKKLHIFTVPIIITIIISN